MDAGSKRYIRAGRVQLHVQVEGVGPPVLLLHGFPDSHEVWRLQVPALVASGYQVIAPDLPGFGLSDAPAHVESYTISQVVGDVMALLEALQVTEQVRLVGHDWGSAIGWALLFAHPERFVSYAALSLGHLSAFRDAGPAQWLKSWYVAAFQMPALPEFALKAFHWAALRRIGRGNAAEVERWLRDLGRPGRLTAGLNWYRANFWSLIGTSFPRVHCPVLGIWSTGDFALTEEQMTDSEAWVGADWRYARVAGAGHWVQVDQPERVNALLLDWFRGG